MDIPHGTIEEIRREVRSRLMADGNRRSYENARKGGKNLARVQSVIRCGPKAAKHYWRAFCEDSAAQMININQSGINASADTDIEDSRAKIEALPSTSEARPNTDDGLPVLIEGLPAIDDRLQAFIDRHTRSRSKSEIWECIPEWRERSDHFLSKENSGASANCDEVGACFADIQTDIPPSELVEAISTEIVGQTKEIHVFARLCHVADDYHKYLKVLRSSKGGEAKKSAVRGEGTRSVRRVTSEKTRLSILEALNPAHGRESLTVQEIAKKAKKAVSTTRNCLAGLVVDGLVAKHGDDGKFYGIRHKGKEVLKMR